MKYMERNLPVCHTLNKAGGCLLIIICCKRCSQPKTKRPGWRQGRFSCKIRIFFYSFHGTSATDKVIIQSFSFYGKLDPLYLFTGNLKSNISQIVHQNPVSFIRYIKWNVLVCNLAGCTAILIPHLYNLSIFHKRRKPFSKTIDVFIYVNGKLFQHISLLCLIIIHMGQIPETGLCKEFLSFIESQLITGRSLIDHRPQGAGTIDYLGICLRDLNLGIFLVHLCNRSLIQSSRMMHCRDLDHSFHRAGKGQRQHRDI